MGEDVTDQSLVDVTDLDMGQAIDESAMTRALKRFMGSGGASNSFQATI